MTIAASLKNLAVTVIVAIAITTATTTAITTATTMAIATAFATIIATVAIPPAHAADEPTYHDGRAAVKAMKNIAGKSDRVRLHELALSPGRQKIRLLEIAPHGEKAHKEATGEPSGPAALVIANPLGTTPLATEAALRLAALLAENESGHAAVLRWYVLPMANPDAADRFFAHPQRQDGRNLTPVDVDKDGAFAEDPPDDLDGDGLITTMLLTDPAGSWLLTEDVPRLLKQADPAKGETGLYLRQVEGDDDDGDGRWNEDGPGGIIVGKNFPHGFEYWTTDGGRWAASEPETRAILDFAFAQPGIVLAVVLGEVNTLARLPEADQQAQAGKDKYKVPRWIARGAGLDTDTEYPLADLVAMARDMTGQKNLSEEDVIGFLGLGAAVNPNPKDLGWWQAIADEYQEAMDEAGLGGSRVDPPPSQRASVEEWAYFQFGVPTFALDFWSVPKAEGEAGADSAATGGGSAGAGDLPEFDEIEQMSSEELIGLGKETISALLAAYDAPPHITTSMVIGALESGMLTPQKIAELLREQAAKEEAGGVDPDLKALAEHARSPGATGIYRDWQEVTLADGQTALIGGPAPFALRTPPAAMIDSLLTPQVPLILGLAEWLPRLDLAEIEIEHRGADVYELTVHLRNDGRISYPTAQGVRCRRPPPVGVTIEGVEILEGTQRQVIAKVPALGTASVRWLVRGAAGSEVSIEATAPVMPTASKTITLDEQGGGR